MLNHGQTEDSARGGQQPRSLDGIIVSHPDIDHYNLIAQLFEEGECLGAQNGSVMLSGGIKLVGQVVLTKAFTWKKTIQCQSFLESLKRLKLKPVVVPGEEIKGKDNLIKMATCFSLHFPMSKDGCSGLVYGRNVSQEDSTSVNSEVESNAATDLDYNKTSTILNIGNIAILTGDAHAETLQAIGLKPEDRSTLKAFQVPHHGSRRQYSRPGDKEWKQLLVYRSMLKYQKSGQPHDLVRHLPYHAREDAIDLYEEAYFSSLRCKLDNTVTQDSVKLAKHLCQLNNESTWAGYCSSIDSQISSSNPPKDLVESYRDIKLKVKKELKKVGLSSEAKPGATVDDFFNCLENVQGSDLKESIADFYEDFPSKVYTISCGSRYNHPHEEVLSGIILSVIRKEQQQHNKKRKCQPVTILVVSGVASLKDKIVRLPPYVDTAKASEFVVIKYLSQNVMSIDVDLLSDNNPLHSNNKLLTWLWDATAKPFDSSYTRQITRGENDALNYNTDYLGRVKHEDEDPPLSEYLKVVNPSLNSKEMNLSSVLKLLVGPQIERTMSKSCSSSRTQNSTSSLLNKALAMNVKEESEFILSGETHRQSAKSAKLILQLPDLSLSFMESNVKAINVDVQNAKTLDLSLKVDVELAPEGQVKRTVSLDFSELCLDISSIGRPLSVLLSEIGSHAKAEEYTVGAILGLMMGGVRAQHLIRSFPIKLSASLAEWKLNLSFTVINFETSGQNIDFFGAFIVGVPPSQPNLEPIKLSPTLDIVPTTLEIKVPPLMPHSTDGVHVSGCCIVNDKDKAQYKATSKSYGCSKVEIEFTDQHNPADLSEFTGVVNKAGPQCQIQVLNRRLDQCTIVSSGLIVEQPADYYPDTRVSSVFFQLDPGSTEIQHLLPDYLKKQLRLDTVKAISLSPPTDTTNLGLEAVFVCDIVTPMELMLQILPLSEEMELYQGHTSAGLPCNSYSLTLRPLATLQKKDGNVKVIAQPSILQVVETFCPECKFEQVLLSFPKLNAILDNLQLKYFHTRVNPSLQSLPIQQFELKLFVPSLEIIPQKLTIEDANLDFFYSKEHVSIGSDCKITVFEEYVCMVTFSLPTPDKEGHFSIRNYSNELTLKRGLEGFGIPKSFTELPLISMLLEITIKNVSLSLDHDYSITNAELTIYKEELTLGTITLSQVELTATYAKDTSSTTNLSFFVQGFIGDSLFATLLYDSSDSILSGSIAACSKAGKGVKLSSVLHTIGLHKPNIPENIEELFHFMDLEVISATLSLKMHPSVAIETLEINLKSGGSLELTSDPRIVLNEIDLHILYKESDGHSISIQGVTTLSSIIITLKGEVGPEGMSLHGSVEQPFNFISTIESIQSDHDQLVIPDVSDIREKLSSMHSLKFSILLEKSKTTHIMVECFSSLELSVDVGICRLTLQSLGAKLNVTTHEKSLVQYSGYVFGHFFIHNFQVEARLALVPEGKGMDIVFIGCCRNMEAMRLETLTNTVIETLPVSTSEPKTETSSLQIASNLPHTMLNVEVQNAILAMNITQKRMLFYLKLKEIGSGLIMFSQTSCKTECLFGVSLPHGFRLQQISDVLAPIDDVIIVKELHLLIVAMESANLDEVLHSFQKATTESSSAVEALHEAGDSIEGVECVQVLSPLASFKSTDTVFVREKELKRGFYLYCKIDIPALKQNDSIFGDVIRLSESDFPDIVMSMYIKQAGFEKDDRELSLTTYIPSMVLLGEINFRNVYLEYKMSKSSEVTLSGELSISLGENDITIMGCMHISKQAIKFVAQYHQRPIDPISSPLGVSGVTLQNIRCEVELRKENKKAHYTVALKGRVKFTKPQLSFESGVVFKNGRPVLLVMSVEGTLMLSEFLKAAFDFEAISRDSFLDIGLRNGSIVYAREAVPYDGYATKEGFNAMCTIIVMKREFKIIANFTKKPALQFEIEGSMVGGAIDILGLIELKSPDFSSDSVVLGCSYSSDEGFKLLLKAGVALLGHKAFRTIVSYSSRGIFEGEVKCAFEFLSEMCIGFQWSKEKGFKIVKWPAAGDLPIQKVLDILETVYDIISLIMAAASGGLSAIFSWAAKYIIKKCLKFKFEMEANLEENTDPEKYRVIIGLRLKFVVRFIKKKLFEADLVELKVKIGKNDGLSQLPRRIWEAFKEWIQEKFSHVFSKISESDKVEFVCATIPSVISTLNEFHKHFKDFTHVIRAVSVLSLNIKAITTMDKEEQKQKKQEKEKLERLLEKHQMWLKENQEFINAACKFRSRPNIMLPSPQMLKATWDAPLKGGSYTYEIHIRTVDSSGFTHQVVNTTTSNNSIEITDTMLAHATKIIVAVRSKITLTVSMWSEELGAGDSDNNFEHTGEWSEAVVLKQETAKPEGKPLELVPPVKVTIAYNNCSKLITGKVYLTVIPNIYVIILQLLDDEIIVSTQPAHLSGLKVQGLEKVIEFAFDTDTLPSNTCGPFTVQAQVLGVCGEGKSNFTRSENQVTRTKQPEWLCLQYHTEEDTVVATVKSFDNEEDDCSVEFMVGTSIQNSKVIDIPMRRKKGREEVCLFTADGAHIRKMTKPGSDKLTCLACDEGQVNKIRSRPVLSWPKEPPIYLLPSPTDFQSEFICSDNTTSHGCIKLQWHAPKDVSAFLVGLTEMHTSRLIHSEHTECCQCIIKIDTLTAIKSAFACFVCSYGDTNHINSEKVMSKVTFYPLPRPSIQYTDFDYSTSTLTVTFSGDEKASYYFLQYTLAYHSRESMSKIVHVEQAHNSEEEWQQECLIHFEEDMLQNCFSIQIAIQAVGQGNYISSQFQTSEAESEHTAVILREFT